MADGAIRDCRICAREERIAIWMDWNPAINDRAVQRKHRYSHPASQSIRSLLAQIVQTAPHLAGAHPLDRPFEVGSTVTSKRQRETTAC